MGKKKKILSFFQIDINSFLLIRMIYSTTSRILCLQNEINRTRVHSSQVFIEISTSNTNFINYSLQLENMTQFLLQ
jgi:hypothetical protein